MQQPASPPCCFSILQVEKVVYGQSDGVELQLAGGGTLRARRAVITVPLGVLKAGDVAFEPPLPEEKADAISSLGFGVLDKVQDRHLWPIMTHLRCGKKRLAAGRVAPALRYLGSVTDGFERLTRRAAVMCSRHGVLSVLTTRAGDHGVQAGGGLLAAGDRRPGHRARPRPGAAAAVPHLETRSVRILVYMPQTVS